MKSKILPKQTRLIIIYLGLFFTIFLLYYIFQVSSLFFTIQKNTIQSDEFQRQAQLMLLKNSTIPKIQEQKKYGTPSRLKIPAINVDATVEHVGLTADGAMDVPANSLNVAWYSLGQRPGEIGSAVIDGHYGRIDGKSSVFDNLHKLQPGDKIYTEDDQGLIMAFVVRTSQSLTSESDASTIFYSKDNQAHLNLITCEGVWDKKTKDYPMRLIVFTDEMKN